MPLNEDEPSATGRHQQQRQIRYTNTFRKDLVIEEEAMQLLIGRDSDTIVVYTAARPTCTPCRTCSNDQYQGHRITLPAKLFYAVGGLVLISVALIISFCVPADHIYRSEHPWKFWSVLAGHVLCLSPAFYSCHFVHRKRIEARCTVLGQYGRQVLVRE